MNYSNTVTVDFTVSLKPSLVFFSVNTDLFHKEMPLDEAVWFGL